MLIGAHAKSFSCRPSSRWTSLLLPLPDGAYTPVPPPTGQPSLTVTYPGGPHLLRVHLAALTGTEPPDGRGDYGYALYRGIMPQDGAALEQAASVRHYLMKPLLLGEKLLHYETMILEDVLTEAGLTSKWLEQGREEGVEEKALKVAIS